MKEKFLTTNHINTDCQTTVGTTNLLFIYLFLINPQGYLPWGNKRGKKLSPDSATVKIIYPKRGKVCTAKIYFRRQKCANLRRIFHYQTDRFEAVAVIVLVLFCSDGHTRIVSLHLAVVIIFRLYRYEGIYIPDVDAYFPLGFVLNLHHRFHSVVHYVAEQAVQVGIAYKAEARTVGETRKAYAVLSARKTLFGKNEVKRIIARLYGRIVYIDNIFKVLYILFVKRMLLGILPYLMFQVVTLQIEQHNIFVALPILFFRLVQQKRERLHLAFQLFLHAQFDLYIQNEDTAYEVIHAGKRSIGTVVTFRDIYGDGVHNYVYKQYERGDDSYRKVAYAHIVAVDFLPKILYSAQYEAK